MVVLLTESPTRYAISNVHLIRPIGQNKEKHATQLKTNDANTVIVVLDDFNGSRKEMHLLSESGALTGYASIHLANEAYDWIFIPGKKAPLKSFDRPTLKRSNDYMKMIWTDHYLIKGALLGNLSGSQLKTDGRPSRRGNSQDSPNWRILSSAASRYRWTTRRDSTCNDWFSSGAFILRESCRPA